MNLTLWNLRCTPLLYYRNRAATLAGYSQENEKKFESFDLHTIAISMVTVFDPNWSSDVKTSSSIEFNAGESIGKTA